jgi:hypothetical protein
MLVKKATGRANGYLKHPQSAFTTPTFDVFLTPDIVLGLFRNIIKLNNLVSFFPSTNREHASSG